MVASDDDGLTVSISQLREFAICPRRYFLHRVLAVEPAFVPLPLALGAATHAAMGSTYTSIRDRGQAPELPEVLQVFRDAWTVEASGAVPIKVEDDEPDPVDVGVRMVTAFHRHVAADLPVRVVAVELPFRGVELHDPDTGEVLDETLSGVMDLVVHEDDHHVVVEHKTAARRWSAEQLEHDLQLTAYQVAARHVGLGEVGLRYQVVTKAKLPVVQAETVVRDDLAEVDFMRTAAGVLRATGAGAFWPVRSWACASCPYAHACSDTRR